MKFSTAGRLLDLVERAERKATFWEAEAKRQDRWVEVYSAKSLEYAKALTEARKRIEELEAQLSEANNMISEMP